MVDAGAETTPSGISVSKSLPAYKSGSLAMEPRQSQVHDYIEKMSLGGESVNSTEFETVSLIEDTGKGSSA